MTTAELVKWMNDAIELSEASWTKKDGSNNPAYGYYKINRHEALEKLAPNGVQKFEISMAGALVGWGNDVTDWYAESTK